jgi:hypothetical protein
MALTKEEIKEYKSEEKEAKRKKSLGELVE